MLRHSLKRYVLSRMRVQNARFASNTNLRIIVPSQNYIQEQTEYRQLPDDSRFISSYFEEMKDFKEYLSKSKDREKKSFTDYEDDPNALISELEKFIQYEIFPKYASANQESLGLKILYNKYIDLLKDFKRTLLLNGGHPFIFDLLLYNREIMKDFEED